MKVEDILRPRPSDSCLLCSGKPSFVGLFAPDNSQEWGAAQGQARFFRYCLCHGCRTKDKLRDKVEIVLWAEVNAGRSVEGHCQEVKH